MKQSTVFANEGNSEVEEHPLIFVIIIFVVSSMYLEEAVSLKGLF